MKSAVPHLTLHFLTAAMMDGAISAVEGVASSLIALNVSFMCFSVNSQFGSLN